MFSRGRLNCEVCAGFGVLAVGWSVIAALSHNFEEIIAAIWMLLFFGPFSNAWLLNWLCRGLCRRLGSGLSSSG